MMVSGSKLSADASAKDHVERLLRINDDVHYFCVDLEATRVAIEEYAFSAGRQSHAHSLAELGGTIKLRIFRSLGIVVEPITASHARKVLLQKCPRKGAKDFAVVNVRRLGPIAKAWTEDECDAFAIANTILMRAGGTALTFEGLVTPG